jgi:hypothetical protein
VNAEEVEQIRRSVKAEQLKQGLNPLFPIAFKNIDSLCDLAQKGLKIQEEKRAERLPEEDFGLTQNQNILIRLALAGDQGLLTGELFAGLHCAKYTGRISDLRQKGFVIEAKPEKILAGGLETSQWRYRLMGYEGYIPDNWPKVVVNAVERWKQGIERQPSLI